MRAYANKVDGNQAEIVRALRDLGAIVQPLNRVGDGCPDLLVGYRGRNLLMEVKKSLKEALTDDQKTWHAEWRGQVVVVCTAADAVAVLLAIYRRKPK